MQKMFGLIALFVLSSIVLVGCDSEPVKSTEKLRDSIEVKTKNQKGNMVKDELPTLPNNLRK